MAYHDWNGFRIEHCPAQQVSYASLLDERGNFVKGFAPLEADGHDHERDIYTKIEDWLSANPLAKVAVAMSGQSLAAVETLKGAA
jgi:hypothetical protein